MLFVLVGSGSLNPIIRAPAPVNTGNTAGDDAVEVGGDTVAVAGGSVTVTFDVAADASSSHGPTDVSN